MKNLWPEDIGLVTDDLNAPVNILKEQASLLGKNTQNLVEADLERLSPTINKKFNFAFIIVAPTLGNYQYELFSISHGIEPYPIIINVDDDIQAEIGSTDAKGNLVAESEDEFIEILKKILNSKKTKKVIGTLLSIVSYDDTDIPF